MAQRILVYGVTGSGKTTMAKEIGDRTGLPVVLVDELTWKPGWVPVPLDEQRRIIGDVCDQDRWVVDSAYGAWLDIPLARADLIVVLDYPRLLSLSRLIRRCVVNTVTRRTMCNGNTETLRHLVSRDSIVLWHFSSFRRKQRRMRAWPTDPRMPPVVSFRRPRAAQDWMESLTPLPTVPGPTP
jgi:adenylate kinase family enzyme